MRYTLWNKLTSNSVIARKIIGFCKNFQICTVTLSHMHPVTTVDRIGDVLLVVRDWEYPQIFSSFMFLESLRYALQSRFCPDAVVHLWWSDISIVNFRRHLRVQWETTGTSGRSTIYFKLSKSWRLVGLHIQVSLPVSVCHNGSLELQLIIHQCLISPNWDSFPPLEIVGLADSTVNTRQCLWFERIEHAFAVVI